jgi:hypothetical protein
MSQNPFDKASRFAAKIDPATFLVWATGLPAEQLVFHEWLDTRAAALPGSADRTSDTIARVTNPAAVEAPWAIAVEFQIEPDPLMFGRLMVYLGHLWQVMKPDEERGSRYNIAAIVVNLTGNGAASRDMRWADAKLAMQLEVVERNLARENADDLLTGIESGRWSRGVLPWLPLMTGGDDPGIIARWKKIADAEPDFRQKAAYATLAMTFASAVDREAVWKKSLEDWNVIESSVVNEWKADQAAIMVIAVLEAKFGTVPPELDARIRAPRHLSILQTWVTQAATAATLDDFRKAAGL